MAQEIIIHPSAEWLYFVWVSLTGLIGVGITALAIKWRTLGMKSALKKVREEYPEDQIIEKHWVTRNPRKVVRFVLKSGREVKYEISRGTEDAFRYIE